MKAKKAKAVQKLFEQTEISKIPSHSPIKSKHPEIDYTSFVRRRSVMVCKLLTNKPTTAVAIMKHVWEQEYKHPEKRKLINKYWNKHVTLAEMILEIGKQKGRKNDAKLHQYVYNLKQKYNSLRQACHFADISWTKFHRQTYVKSTRIMYVNYLQKTLMLLGIITNQIIFPFLSWIKNTREKGLCATVLSAVSECTI